MNIAWAITGAGHYLKETFEIMGKLSWENEITTFVSKSGEEVVKAYGLWDPLGEISPGGYLKEVITSRDSGASSPRIGRFFLKKYGVLIVSPTTANTVAKIAHGISDNIVTNAVSSACKSMTPVFVVPVDSRPGEMETSLPYFIDKEICVRCEDCRAEQICSQKAIKDFHIDLLRCTGCGECIGGCEFRAIVAGRRVKIKVRNIDVENVERLDKMEFVKVLNSPGQILEELSNLG